MCSNYFHSVVLNPDRCIGCTCCLKICPTEAIRLKGGKASIIAERCIDCGECIRVCPDNAKNAITDDFSILKNFKYTVALTLPILYGQFRRDINPGLILSALKTLGFNEALDTSIGSEVVDTVGRSIIDCYKAKPVINSSCPAILRLIQVRFPELLDNIIDIETPVEITARMVKKRVVQTTGLNMHDVGIILITPCTARVTSIKNPLGMEESYVDATISIKDIYGPLLKALNCNELRVTDNASPTQRGMLWYSTEGQISSFNGVNTLAVDGINNAIPILEEIEMGRLNNISYIEITSCPGSCLGGPLTVENRFIALNRIKKIAYSLAAFNPSKDEIQRYINMYEEGFIRFNRKILPKSVMSLDKDITKSIKKMDCIQNIVKDLPGINCGICGSPTCQAFAEDIVTGRSSGTVCPVSKIGAGNNIKYTKKQPGGVI